MSTAPETKPAIDLENFDITASAEKGAKMEVRHPATGEVLRHDDGRAFTITLVGRDSDRFMKLARAQSDRRLQQTMRSRSPMLTGSVEKDDIELLVNATLEWDIILGGKQPPSDAKNYRDAYTRFRWLREQVDEFVGNRAHFSMG
jgi:hypothetical protein